METLRKKVKYYEDMMRKSAAAMNYEDAKTYRYVMQGWDWMCANTNCGCLK